jgi:hypothetical protein
MRFVPPTATGLFLAITRCLHGRTAAGDDAREDAHALCVGGGEGELAQEGVVADDLGEASEGYVGFPCTYSMNK